MTMIKCSECGKDISDKAEICIGCGAPISERPPVLCSNSVDEGKINDMFNILKDKTSTIIDDAISFGKEALKSQEEKDAEAVENLNQITTEVSATETLESKKFKAALESTINVKIAEIMKAKGESEKHLSYFDAQIMSATIENIFKSALSFTPPQVTAACSISSAILAPSAKEKQKILKGAIGIAGGTAGIGLIIGGVGTALGWGASIVATVTAAFVGTSMAGPIGWTIAGITIAGVAGYFALSSNDETDTERYIKVLKAATSKAVDAIWEEHGADLSKAIDRSV